MSAMPRIATKFRNRSEMTPMCQPAEFNNPSKISIPSLHATLGDARRSTGEAVTEHWQTALRLRASRLILENVPVGSANTPSGNAHDVGGNPVFLGVQCQRIARGR